MKTDQLLWTKEGKENYILDGIQEKENAQLILVFGDRLLFEQELDWLPYLKSKYSKAEIVSITATGAITNDDINEDSFFTHHLF